MTLTNFYTLAVSIFESLGVVVIVVGVILAIVFCLIALGRGKGGRVALTTLRNVLGGGILLGLEVFVAADLVRTITQEPTLENALALLIIVLVRTILSFTIQIEIEGVVPWKRALLESGALVAARGAKQALS